MKNLSCYLCGREPEMVHENASSLNITVSCPFCKYYEITHEALFFFFGIKDNKEIKQNILDSDDKKKLSEYVTNNFDPKKNIPVLLDTNCIEKVTGKKSINIRYS